jgi:hypothetical protein
MTVRRDSPLEHRLQLGRLREQPSDLSGLPLAFAVLLLQRPAVAAGRLLFSGRE